MSDPLLRQAGLLNASITYNKLAKGSGRILDSALKVHASDGSAYMVESIPTVRHQLHSALMGRGMVVVKQRQVSVMVQAGVTSVMVQAGECLC